MSGKWPGQLSATAGGTAGGTGSSAGGGAIPAALPAAAAALLKVRPGDVLQVQDRDLSSARVQPASA